MLKTKQADLRKIIAEQRLEMQLKCADCMGYFADEYQPCSDKHCPLRKYYPTRKMAKDCQWFKKEMTRLAEKRDNPPSIVR